ncbi:acyl-CoA wax alcohol acyltransferase 2 [Callorhinus ursinus]|uniref:acyl-CoA wax alcohol acyltransferase 2 n=1 Tax=Callorhinus ursinus TaxID=34884 RepID=UPI003CD028DF
MLLPSKKDLKIALEVFALFQWVLSAFIMGVTAGFVNLYLVLFTPYWPVTVLILTWLAFDWKTPPPQQDTSGFSKIFPGITPYMLTLGVLFWVPLLRDYVMSSDLYDQYIFTPGGLVNRFQKWMQRMIHIYPCAFYGRGFTENSWGLLPYARPVTAVVRKPLPLPKIENPSQETVARYHALYIDALCKLYDQHKTKYGISETQELVIT